MYKLQNEINEKSLKQLSNIKCLYQCCLRKYNKLIVYSKEHDIDELIMLHDVVLYK